MEVIQQRKKMVSVAAFLGLTLILVLPGTAYSQGGDPQHDLIMQVMEGAAQDLGYSVSWDGTLMQSPRQHYKYGVSSPDHRSNLL